MKDFTNRKKLHVKQARKPILAPTADMKFHCTLAHWLTPKLCSRKPSPTVSVMVVLQWQYNGGRWFSIDVVDSGT